jgi:CheY-like chemotaxis protein
MIYSTKTILCVDDDVDDFEMLQEALTGIEASYEIISAYDGVHALELLQQMKQCGQLPCLIVLDINMPRMDGKQTLSAIQRDSSLSSIPLVLFSTSSSELDKTFSLLKHVELITKPLTLNTLQGVAAKLLHYCDDHLIAETFSLDGELLVE